MEQMKPTMDKKKFPDIKYKTGTSDCYSEEHYSRTLHENQHPALSSQLWLKPQELTYQLYILAH